LATERTEVFQHPAARPVGIGAVIEDDIDKREAVEGIPSDNAGVRYREHLRGDRVGDLVLHDLRSLAGPFGIDDDLRVREIGNRVERQIAQGEDAADGQRRSREQNESTIPERKLNDCLEHGWRQESKTEWVRERIDGGLHKSHAADRAFAGRSVQDRDMLGHRADIGGLRWRRFLVRGMFAGRGLQRMGSQLTRPSIFDPA
jgi:hypothetical protein